MESGHEIGIDTVNATPANAGTGGYHLKSEMARVCLPDPHVHTRRRLAWTNSICILFLIIGLVGFRPKPPPPKAIKPLEAAAPVIVEPTPPPPPTVATKLEEEPKEQSASEAPRVVVVTPESPSIIFSVPTIGNVVAPNALAEAPPVAPLRQVVATSNLPAPLNNTGQGGDRPEPRYPELALQLGQQGSVVLSLTADAAGIITSAEIKETSGSSILDHFSVDFVKRHWTVAPGAPGRLFEAKINYVLRQSN